MKGRLWPFSLLVACGAPGGPDSDQCSQTGCEPGYACGSDGRCEGALSVSGQVRLVMPVQLPDSVSLFVLAYDDLSGGLDCSKAIASTSLSISTAPAPYALPGVPPGDLWVVGAFPNQPVEGTVYAGYTHLVVAANGEIHDGLGGSLETVDIVIDGGVTYACE